MAVVRTALGTDGFAGAVGPTSEGGWQKFSREVARQRLGPFLFHRLPATITAALPAAVVQRLQRAAEITAQHADRQAGELVRLVQTLEAAGIRTLSVKGPLLSLQLYGSTGLRHGSDLDLVVPPEDAGRADALLRRVGCERIRPDFELTPRQQREYLRVQYEFEYSSPDSRLRVELMWRLEGVSDRLDIWTSPDRLELNGHSFHLLPPELNALYLCVHGARHGWCRLFWLLDVALLLRRDEIDWEKTLALARAHGAERSVLQAGRLARRLFAATLPAAFRSSPAEARIVAGLSAEACRQIALKPEDENGTIEWFRQLLYRLRLSRGARARLAVLQPHFVSLSSWKMVRLPDRWFALYHVLTPFLWLYRRCAR